MHLDTCRFLVSVLWFPALGFRFPVSTFWFPLSGFRFSIPTELTGFRFLGHGWLWPAMAGRADLEIPGPRQVENVRPRSTLGDCGPA